MNNLPTIELGPEHFSCSNALVIVLKRPTVVNLPKPSELLIGVSLSDDSGVECVSTPKLHIANKHKHGASFVVPPEGVTINETSSFVLDIEHDSICIGSDRKDYMIL